MLLDGPLPTSSSSTEVPRAPTRPSVLAFPNVRLAFHLGYASRRHRMPPRLTWAAPNAGEPGLLFTRQAGWSVYPKLASCARACRACWWRLAGVLHVLGIVGCAHAETPICLTLSAERHPLRASASNSSLIRAPLHCSPSRGIVRVNLCSRAGGIQPLRGTSSPRHRLRHPSEIAALAPRSPDPSWFRRA